MTAAPQRFGWKAAWKRAPFPPRTEFTPIPAGSGVGYGSKALVLESAKVAQAVNGTRNDTLNVAAFNLSQLVAGGSLDDAEVRTSLAAAATSAGLEEPEISATINSGFKAGLLLPRTPPPLASQVTEVSVLELVPALPDGPAGEPAEEPEDRTTWWPSEVRSIAAAAHASPRPTHLVRDDGEALFYSGKVNGLIGEAESGKSWVLQFAIAQALQTGHRVLLLDFEDSAAGLLDRLLALGCSSEQLALVDYASPQESLGLAQSRDLGEALARAYNVIGVDGVNAAMTLLGFDINSNTDATVFATTLLRPLARTGACVITVDHVPKATEQRGKGGIGAQAKRSMMDGCCLAVEVVEPFGKGQNGILRLRVDKDRTGVVRGISAGSSNPGRVLITSVADQVRIQVTSPDVRPAELRGEFRYTAIMEKVSKWLELEDLPVSQKQVSDAVSGKREHVLAALRSLIGEGYVAIEAGPRGAVLHTSARPYRQSEDPASDEFPRPVPAVPDLFPPVPGIGQTTCSPTPSPYGEGNRSEVQENSSTCSPDGADEKSACNKCGEEVSDRILELGHGYCSVCARQLKQ